MHPWKHLKFNPRARAYPAMMAREALIALSLFEIPVMIVPWDLPRS